jgi:hypothetical protein
MHFSSTSFSLHFSHFVPRTEPSSRGFTLILLASCAKAQEKAKPTLLFNKQNVLKAVRGGRQAVDGSSRKEFPPENTADFSRLCLQFASTEAAAFPWMLKFMHTNSEDGVRENQHFAVKQQRTAKINAKKKLERSIRVKSDTFHHIFLI